jgi:hypothetical protein
VRIYPAGIKNAQTLIRVPISRRTRLTERKVSIRRNTNRATMDPRQSARKTFRSFSQILPVLLGVLLLISLVNAAIPAETYAGLFTGNVLIDPVLGALFGSIAGGNPITSYIIGGELIAVHISLTAVTAFILSWVTVGLISLPAEMDILGKRFALARNLISFVFSIVIAVLVEITLTWLGVAQ